MSCLQERADEQLREKVLTEPIFWLSALLRGLFPLFGKIPQAALDMTCRHVVVFIPRPLKNLLRHSDTKSKSDVASKISALHIYSYSTRLKKLN